MMKQYRNNFGASFGEYLLFVIIIAVVAYFIFHYYKSEGVSRKADAVMAQMNAINAAATKLAVATNSYAGNVSTDAVASVLNDDAMRTPWGTYITITGTNTNSYSVNIPDMPAQICRIILKQYANNPSFDMSGNVCPSDPMSSITFTYTYFRN